MKDAMVRFIDCAVPTENCNLRCPYCYIAQKRSFSGKMCSITRTPKEVRQALSRKRFGGTMFINFCAGGETLLGNDILPIIHTLLEEGHFVQIVTNGTIDCRFDEMAQWDKELLDRVLVKFSFHYTELKRLGWIDKFFDNIIKIRNAGASFSLEITPGDEMVPWIDEMKKISVERLGALPHVTIARDEKVPGFQILTKYSKEEYMDIWNSFDSQMFQVKTRLFGEKREEYCYGGEWTLYLDLQSGNLKQCYRGAVIDNIYDEVSEPIHFRPIGCNCPEHYCYNGHAWMLLGCIPNIQLPKYSDIRNRVGVDGREWLTPTMKKFLSQKLEENNIIYKCTGKVPKVLLIGDSIGLGYRKKVQATMKNLAEIYYPKGDAKSATYLLENIRVWAKDMHIGTNIDVVYFNVGVCDLLPVDGKQLAVDLGVYASGLVRIIETVKYIFPNAKIVFATTTPVNEADVKYSAFNVNEKIVEYNEQAKRVMHKQGVLVNDLYSLAANEISKEYSDSKHFNEKGYEILAKEVSKCLVDIVQGMGEFGALGRQVKDSEIVKSLQHLETKRIVVYGAGEYGEKVIQELQKRGITPYVVCDRNIQKQGSKCKGIPVVSPEEYINTMCEPKADILIIAIRDMNIVRNVLHRFENLPELMICTWRMFDVLR